MLFKITHAKEIHVLKLKEKQSFEDLKAAVKQAFKNLPAEFQFAYVDEDGDEISLACEQDFRTLSTSDRPKVSIRIVQICSSNLELSQGDESFSNISLISRLSKEASVRKEQVEIKLAQSDSKPVKIQEKIEKVEEEKDPKVHKDIMCDQCEALPIIGVRYKCTVCPDYDICEKCEPSSDHIHALIKIKYANQEFVPAEVEPFKISYFTEKIVDFSQKLKIKKGLSNIMSHSVKIATALKEYAGNLAKSEQVDEAEKLPVRPDYNLPQKEQKQKFNMSEQDRLVVSASYLSSILGIDFTRCYQFTKNHPKLSQQDLVIKYFENVKEI